MKTAKHFDCVAMKNRIQAQEAERHGQRSEEEIRRQTQQELNRSSSPVGKLWRSLDPKANDAP
jgi:hypothetical protein